ncbi:MAG: hypothetical protein QNJ45_12590 [Ardenticatenaceae bacterium]|nr:hypothetical protein [Ardenticatenaceae bacterium]
MNSVTDFLLEADEPWTRYRTYLDLLDYPADNPEVVGARSDMLRHPQIKNLRDTAASWPGYALKRHNDAKHPLYALSTLADFGIRHDDPGMGEALAGVMSHQSAEGPFQTQVRLYKRFGGLEGEYWTWMACDAPTLTYTLVAMGLGEDERVQRAVEHLLSQVHDNGYRCSAAPELGTFHGPGRRDDPCPIANVYALKVLSLQPEWRESPAARQGCEMLLDHWARQGERKIYLFGIGTDFRKLKYPFVWYDILHVTDVLSRFPMVHSDARLREMVEMITTQADENGCYTATSMYRAWKGWSFADKKRPSSWLTFLVTRIEKRLSLVEQGCS